MPFFGPLKSVGSEMALKAFALLAVLWLVHGLYIDGPTVPSTFKRKQGSLFPECKFQGHFIMNVVQFLPLFRANEIRNG